MQLHILRRAFGHQQAAGVAAFGAQVDQPVGGADHVEVVLDHDERVAAFEQLAQGAHELGDVVEVQAGGRLVEQEQRAAGRGGLPAGGGALGGLRQEARQLEALRFAARQRGHRLAQLHVFQADVDDGLQRADHVAVVGEQRSGLAHGEVQHVGHVQHARVAARRWAGARSSLPGSRAGSACRRNPGSAGTRRRGTASPRARSPSRRRSGSARRRC